jgi:hypothetical protein
MLAKRVDSKKLRALLPLALAIPLLIIILAAPSPHVTPVIAQSGGFTQMEELPPDAQQVFVGVYANNVYNLDIQNNTFYLDAYVWFRWKGDIDPTATVEFINAVEEWGMVQTNILEEPSELADGSKYQIMRIESRFVQPFTLADFPLDAQQLTLLIEDTTFSADQLVYVPDTADSGYGDMLKIPGWEITNWSMDSQVHNYGSQFGELGSALATDYSVLRYALNIERLVNFFLWKLLLPLLIVLVAHWCTFLINPTMVEVRTAMPSTALLTTVFLQQSYTSMLPEVGYLVLMDKIYVVAYLLIIATLAYTIVSAVWVHNDETGGVVRAKRLDRLMLIGEVLFFVIALAVILLTRGA